MSLKQKDAFAGMEAFVKHIYASLFLWVVKLLNAALSNGKNDAVNFIGILDIYGLVLCVVILCCRKFECARIILTLTSTSNNYAGIIMLNRALYANVR
jgi:hypothetical protein